MNEAGDPSPIIFATVKGGWAFLFRISFLRDITTIALRFIRIDIDLVVIKLNQSRITNIFALELT